ncbi:hypothetical protein HZA56_14435 [Candidatus Poribacteria bacterium]|nr:hypothetical protein [Candidatus Poribacteria bacterium]
MRQGLPARRWAIFFCLVTLVCGVGGLLVTVSCTHTSARTNEEIAVGGVESDTGSASEPLVDSESSSAQKKKVVRQRVEDVAAELDKARSENATLQEENDRLRSEIARLEGELADANQAIYSLEKKLDAIFWPNNLSE